MTFRVLVCGGRHYPNREAVFQALDDLAAEHGPLFILEGGAHGADRWARQWRADRLNPGKTYPAAWDREGKGAGVIRNRQMLVEGKPDLVLAFPGGKGTLNMIEQASRAGVEVRRGG